jgi:hypothetical protein
MVSMERSDAEKAQERLKNEMPPALSSMPDVPYGLCIRLTETELDKLNIELDEDVAIGDTIHISGLAKVTGIKQNATGAGREECLELAITDLSIEDETTEEAPDGEEE